MESRSVSKACGEIDDAGDDGELCGAGGFWIAISVGENAKGLEAGDGVLDADTEAAEGSVVSALVRGRRFFFDRLYGMSMAGWSF